MIKTPDFDRTFSHHMADVNGVKLHFVKGGTGEPVVLLHGFPQTWFEWHRIMPALAERYTVIAPDLRGMGASSKPASGYDNRTVAEDIHQLVRQLGFQHISIIGHDAGAPVAYGYAAAHPDDVRRLVVIESVIAGTESPLYDGICTKLLAHGVSCRAGHCRVTYRWARADVSFMVLSKVQLQPRCFHRR